MTCEGHGVAWGDRFVQFGDWRYGEVDCAHFSVSHKSGKTAQIYRNDGTLHPGPRSDWNTWSRATGARKGISFGDNFIQFGCWRLGAVDDAHMSISHKDGKTAQIFRNDGTLHPGPRSDWGLWGKALKSNPSGLFFGDKFIQMRTFRVGQVDSAHSSISHTGGKTVQIYRNDGTLHPGPRSDWGLYIRPVLQACALGGSKYVSTYTAGCSGNGVQYGDRFIQFGKWRFGEVDCNHFSVSHQGGKTAQIYRNDGTLHPGPRSDWGLWKRALGGDNGISFGDGFVQLGCWRMGQVDSNHASISHKAGKTAQIFRNDGTLHPGPRSDWGLWKRSVGSMANVKMGDNFLQFGSWRFGQVDGNHASVSHTGGKTAQIYRNDGTLHPGPRSDWGLWKKATTKTCEKK